MNFFSKKSKKSPPSPHDEVNNDNHTAPRQSPSPKKSSTSSSSRSNRRDSKDDRRNSHTSSHSSGSRGPTPISRAHTFDTNTHPLNLPPDLRRLSALSNMNEQPRPEPMDVDSDPHVQPATPTEKMPGAFNAAAANGVNGSENKDRMDVDGAPTPPPHKSAPTSPVAPPAPTPEEAEAFKNAGNKHYKAKEYRQAIEEYTKGTFIRLYIMRTLY